MSCDSPFFAIVHGETTGYGDPVVVAQFVVSAVTAAVLVLVEQHSSAPIFNHSFLLRAPFSGARTAPSSPASASSRSLSSRRRDPRVGTDRLGHPGTGPRWSAR